MFALHRRHTRPSAILTLVALLATATLICGCTGPALYSADHSSEATSEEYDAEPEYAYDDYEADATTEADAVGAATQKDSGSEDSEAVVIRSANITLRSRGYDDALSAIRTAIDDAGGNITNTSENGGGARSITIEARVDPSKLEEVVEELRGIDGCTVQSANVSSDDVTRTYNDTERRIEILNEQYEHYKKMLEEAQTTEDMLLISDRMYEVMAEIKSYTDARDDMRHDADRSLLTVTLLEETSAGEVATPSGGNFAQDAWEDSWGIFGQILRTVAYVLILLVPYLLVATVVVGIVMLVRRRRGTGRKSRKKKQDEGGPQPPQ